MAVMQIQELSRTGRRVIAPMLALLAVIAAACGSGPSPDTANAPAAAKENATTTPQCFDLYSKGPLACALNTIGPGGGLIFYDAGSPQPWGRFLEVAPWNWNPVLTPDFTADCKGGCGADPRSTLTPIENKTQDRTSKYPDTGELASGIPLCDNDSKKRGEYNNLSGAAANTGEAIGTGRTNTNAIFADPECREFVYLVEGAVRLAHDYRGGGLDDWYVPAKDELVELCRFGNRNGVGGFNAGGNYVTSSTETKEWTLWQVEFTDCGASKQHAWMPADPYNAVATYNVRPIRAF